MGRVIQLLLVAMALVGVLYGLAAAIARRRTDSLSKENKRLREENVALRSEESAKVLETEAELATVRESNDSLHEMADGILAFIAGRPNQLDLSGPYQPIIDTITAKRPRRTHS